MVRQFCRDAHRKGGAQPLDARGVAFAVVNHLFFRGNAKTWSSRDIMLRLAVTSVWAPTRSHNSSNVTSGCCFTSARMTAAHAFKARCRPPANGKAATLPVSRQRFTHLSRSTR